MYSFNFNKFEYSSKEMLTKNWLLASNFKIVFNFQKNIEIKFEILYETHIIPD